MQHNIGQVICARLACFEAINNRVELKRVYKVNLKQINKFSLL